jgi:hypothetical protein
MQGFEAGAAEIHAAESVLYSAVTMLMAPTLLRRLSVFDFHLGLTKN